MFDVKSVFASVKKYESEWTREGEPQLFPDEVKAGFASAEVIDGEYGLSCKFTTQDGDYMFMDMDTESAVSIGDKLDINKIRMTKLVKKGKTPIYRILAY